MVLAAGRKIRASELNDALPVMARTTADTTRTSSTTLVDATGFVVALAANTAYAFDAYVPYNAGQTGDLKIALAAPAGATGHWALHGMATSATFSAGDLDARRVDAYGDAAIRVAGGYDDDPAGRLAAMIRGFILTTGTAGNLQVRVAQNASSTISTIIRLGAWLRAHKVA